MNKYDIRKGQIWQSKSSDMQVLIFQKKGDRWLVKKLTHKPGFYHGTHTLTKYTLAKSFTLLA